MNVKLCFEVFPKINIIFQINCLIIDIFLNNQRGVGAHLPAMFCAIGLFGGRPMFGNRLAYLRVKKLNTLIYYSSTII